MSASAIGSSDLGGLASFCRLHRKLLPPCLRPELGLRHRTFCSTTAAATTGDLIDLDVLKQLHHASSAQAVYYSAIFSTLVVFLRPVDMTSLEVFQRKLFSHLSPFEFHPHTLLCKHAHCDNTTSDFKRGGVLVVISGSLLCKIPIG
jgi:hypothetical protein